MSTRTRLALASFTAMLLPAPLFAQLPPPDGNREITRIQDDLYRVRDDGRYTIVLVTREGIILGDPLSFETATWLKAELALRFPEQPVRYVLHSHHHFDRAEGAAVFTATAEVVAHRNFPAALSAARRSWPEFYGIADRNDNGVLDAPEMADSPRGALARAKDRDGNGRVTPDELYRRVLEPETTYDSRRTILLGGRTVELVYTGNAHASDMTALYFPIERVLFVADPPPVTASRFMVGTDAPRDVLSWLDVIGQLDFEIGLTGNNETFSAESIRERRAYFADLIAGVVQGRAAGLSLAQIQALPFLAKYASESFAADRAIHIAAVYRTVRLVNLDMYAAAVGNYALRPAGFCEGFTACRSIRLVPLAAVGLSISGVRRGVTAEFTAGDQSWHTRTSHFYDQEFAARQSRGSVLFRYQPVRRFSSSALVGGLSVTVTDFKGMTHQKEASARVGGLRPFSTRTTTMGVTGGIDVRLHVGGRVGVVVPMRVTHIVGNETNPLVPRTDLQAGVGLTYGFVWRAN